MQVLEATYGDVDRYVSIARNCGARKLLFLGVKRQPQGFDDSLNLNYRAYISLTCRHTFCNNSLSQHPTLFE